MSDLTFVATIPIEKITGIYLLWSKGQVVYVGQSENIMQRIGTHLANPSKDFDAFSYAVVDTNLDQIEADLIVRYNPRLNRTLPQNNTYISISRLKSFYGGWNVKKHIKKHNITPVWKDFYKLLDFISLRSKNTKASEYS